MTKSTAELLENPAYKGCKACGEPVHHRNRSCKACGAPSPWKSEGPITTEQDPVGTSVRPIDVMARSVHEYIGLLEELLIDTGDLRKVSNELDAIAAVSSNAGVDRAKAALRGVEPDVLAESVVDGPSNAQVFMARFSTQIGDTMCHFNPGDVVEDFILLSQLAKLAAPMVPVNRTKGIVCCPNCKTIFPAKTAEQQGGRFAIPRAG